METTNEKGRIGQDNKIIPFKMTITTQGEIKNYKNRQHPKGMLGKHHTEKSKEKMRESKKGEKSHLWKGGITPLRYQILMLPQYKKWRAEIFKRDNFTCRTCKKIGGLLEAHHKKTFSKILEQYKIKTIEQAITCKELWNIENGITLCRSCHKKTFMYNCRNTKTNKNRKI